MKRSVALMVITSLQNTPIKITKKLKNSKRNARNPQRSLGSKVKVVLFMESGYYIASNP